MTNRYEEAIAFGSRAAENQIVRFLAESLVGEVLKGYLVAEHPGAELSDGIPICSLGDLSRAFATAQTIVNRLLEEELGARRSDLMTGVDDPFRGAGNVSVEVVRSDSSDTNLSI